MLPQENYMEKVARMNLERFIEQGYATAGHNGPHGHMDTPVRNTAHYLIIYSYLYKKYKEEQFAKVCKSFFDYLKDCQKQSKSGAIQCMITDRFDHINGLIGQGWVIEALIYYYETFKVEEALIIAKKIFDSQQYKWDKHLWHRIELDGSDIGIDTTSNHNVWFAGCSYKLAKYCNAPEIDAIIRDFLTKGQKVVLNTYSSGLMNHLVACNDPLLKAGRWKRTVRKLLTPLKVLNPRKLDSHYIEYAYHIFDMYGYSMLKSEYGDLPIFNGDDFKKASEFTMNVKRLLKLNHADCAEKTNVYFFPYNTPAFEWPYVAKVNGFYDKNIDEQLWDVQNALMYDNGSEMMSRNNPDIETWNARTYEIIKYIES